MAKVKNAESLENKSSENKTKSSPIAKSKKKQQPAEVLKKNVMQPRADIKPMSEMVPKALQKLTNVDGVSLAAIRKFISTNYSVKMDKENQTSMKQFIGKAFKERQINMTNHDGDLNYTKRFEWVEKSSEPREEPRDEQ